MSENDLKEAMQLKEAEGWNQTGRDCEMLLSNNPDLCLVAISEGKVIATVTAMNYENQLAWIGMMLVQKEYRGLGVGTLLMTHIINELEHCASIKLDATPAGFPVYKKLGFIQENTIYRMTRPPQNMEHIINPDFCVRRALSQDLVAIMEYDKGVFGANRQVVLNHLMNHSLKTSWLIEKDNRIEGFILGRPGSNFFQLGPLIAKSTEAANYLLAAALTELNGSSVVVDILHDKENLINWLQSQGFEIRRELIRMFYGDNSIQGVIQQQFLISGPELG